MIKTLFFVGEEHWTKVLQANEVNSNLLLVPCQGRHSHYNERRRDRCSRSLEESLLALDEHHLRSCARSTASDADSECSRSSRTSRRSKDDPSKDANIFTKLYAKFCQWVAQNRSSSREGSTTHTPRRSRSSSMHSIPGQDLLQLLAHMPDDYQFDDDAASCIHHSLSSEDSELYESLKKHHYSSTCSSLTITSTSTTTSDCPATCPEVSVSVSKASPKRLLSKWINTKEDCTYLAVNDPRTRHSNLTFTISCPLRTKLPSQSAPEKEKVNLCATWPMVSRHKHDQGMNIDLTYYSNCCSYYFML